MSKTTRKEKSKKTEPVMTATWLSQFKAEFQRRTGITWKDAGNTDDEARCWFNGNEDDPLNAVLAYIEKYDLQDVTEIWC